MILYLYIIEIKKRIYDRFFQYLFPNHTNNPFININLLNLLKIGVVLNLICEFKTFEKIDAIETKKCN